LRRGCDGIEVNTTVIVARAIEAQNEDTVKATIVFRFSRVMVAGAAAATLAVASAGCVDVDGGAIEASWVLRTFDGRGISGCACASPEIARVRFVSRRLGSDGALGDDVCAGQSGCEFPCHSQRGATPFFVPTGRYAISIAPLDAQGAPLTMPTGGGDVRVPAPILRDVVFGRPTQLDAVAIESSCAEACNGDQGNKVCSRN
jgi:hypothetical protein